MSIPSDAVGFMAQDVPPRALLAGGCMILLPLLRFGFLRQGARTIPKGIPFVKDTFSIHQRKARVFYGVERVTAASIKARKMGCGDSGRERNSG